MQMDLKRIFQCVGDSISIDCQLDMNDIELYGEYPFSAAAQIRGVIRNHAGVVEMEYSASFPFDKLCDRCCTQMHSEYNFQFFHILVNNLEGDPSDEMIELDGFILDFDELVRTDILLELPTKFLCSEDCKGLCVKCGANLNETQCNCPTREPDPRLAALRELLVEGGAE